MADKPDNANANPVALSQTMHKGLRIKADNSTDHLANSHFARLGVAEFLDAGLDSPIIFLKSPAGNFVPASMWGVEQGENLFLEDGKWTGGYLPAIVRAYPFAVLPDPKQPEHFYIGLFENCPWINQTEGELIIDENGEKTEKLDEIQAFLTQMYQQDMQTAEFMKKLESLDLLVEQTLRMTDPVTSEEKSTGGVFVVDREKFEKLPDETVLELSKNGGLAAIYAHLMSLRSLNRLMGRKNRRAQAQATASQ